MLQIQDKTITGFNIGFNDGIDAGQTIFHCHIHVIPRRKNDVQNLPSGIRNVIHGKEYTDSSVKFAYLQLLILYTTSILA
jgi:diadenosine tetraphosphate (Ap4A) HIT family hydrolase